MNDSSSDDYDWLRFEPIMHCLWRLSVAFYWSQSLHVINTNKLISRYYCSMPTWPWYYYVSLNIIFAGFEQQKKLKPIHFNMAVLV